jgi:DNA-binding NtrC family response regulator
MSYQDAMREARRRYWEALIEKCGGNVTKAAREAKVNRQVVYTVIKQYEIQRRTVLIRQGRWQEHGL